MQQTDIEKLIAGAINQNLEIWADLGSGSGAFTLALRKIAGSGITIYSIDKNNRSLEKQKEFFNENYPGSDIRFLAQDFTKDLNLPQLDGILMANSLHFVKDKDTLVGNLKKILKTTGKLLIIEYDIENGGFFVPFPISFKALSELLQTNGFHAPQLLATTPSRYHNRMYSALAKLK